MNRGRMMLDFPVMGWRGAGGFIPISVNDPCWSDRAVAEILLDPALTIRIEAELTGAPVAVFVSVPVTVYPGYRTRLGIVVVSFS